MPIDNTVALTILVATAVVFLGLLVVSVRASARARRFEAELARKDAAATQAQSQLTAELQEVKKALQDANRRLEKAEKEARDQASSKGTQEVLNFLGLLQAKGRLIDFLMDDVARYSDAQVGAAARIVHQGCASVIREYFDIKPISESKEGMPVTLERDYDPERFRLLGKVVGEPPFKGKLLHHGWRTAAIRLPKPVHVHGKGMDLGVIAPAEVEVH